MFFFVSVATHWEAKESLKPYSVSLRVQDGARDSEYQGPGTELFVGGRLALLLDIFVHEQGLGITLYNGGIDYNLAYILQRRNLVHGIQQY